MTPLSSVLGHGLAFFSVHLGSVYNVGDVCCVLYFVPVYTYDFFFFFLFLQFPEIRSYRFHFGLIRLAKKQKKRDSPPLVAHITETSACCKGTVQPKNIKRPKECLLTPTFINS